MSLEPDALKEPLALTTITTCVHNMRRYLPSAIASVFAQTSTHFEYLILDDGSTDGTWDYLKTFQNHPRIRLLRHSTRQGLCVCRNQMLESAQGEYLSILDADDILTPHKVQLHAEILAADPNVGVVWGRSIVTGDDSFLLPPEGFEPGWDLLTPYQATHSSTTWRKSALIRAGGYDPRWTHVEAPDLFLKVGDRWKQVFSPAVVTLKRLLRDNEFRTDLANAQSYFSLQLLQHTLRRRYGTNAKYLEEKLFNQPTPKLSHYPFSII
ncbi:MAG: glycosyltransferase family 2 protein [Deltaproteobacteria bacterium]|nr:glycosyltransferase family 2 protein [Deltaproteobacteria bacterium]